MITMLAGYVRRWQRTARRLLADPELQTPLRSIGYFLAGFCLSAASLGSSLQPFCLGLLCAGLPEWLPAVYAIGSALGNIALGMSTGLCLGLCFGMFIDARNHQQEDEDDPTKTE